MLKGILDYWFYDDYWNVIWAKVYDDDHQGTMCSVPFKEAIDDFTVVADIEGYPVYSLGLHRSFYDNTPD